ncbi:MAG: hypothetical protein AB8I08_28330 [Sandaracinaceae bacterium]
MSKETKKTLTEGEITQGREVGRRGALAILGAGVVGSAVAAVGITATAAPASAKATDSDTGGNADPAGRGQTGHTDRDSGGSADRAGHGVCAERGHTDSDGGGSADPGGGGRGPCR